MLIALFLYVCHIFYSSGYFRTINYRFDGQLLTKVNIPGAEDMQADYEAGFMIISSDDRASRRDGKSVPGHLYKINLNDAEFNPIQLTKDITEGFYPHGISLLRTSDSTHRIFAINHVGSNHFIEVFDLMGDSLWHVKRLSNPSMISPNDVVGLGSEKFYFTNDHGYTEGIGRLAEEYLGLAVSNVVYYDGTNYTEVADGIAYANGINFDKSRKLLFVASPRGFNIKVYERTKDGSLDYVESIPCETGVDNIEFDASGNLWVGSHPSLLHFTFYASGKNKTAPSEIIKINYAGKGDYQVESIYLEDGSDMSASTVAVPHEDLIFVGNVMDESFLVLRKDSKN